jgi:hypothetical protein
MPLGLFVEASVIGRLRLSWSKLSKDNGDDAGILNRWARDN